MNGAQGLLGNQRTVSLSREADFLCVNQTVGPPCPLHEASPVPRIVPGTEERVKRYWENE